MNWIKQQQLLAKFRKKERHKKRLGVILEVAQNSFMRSRGLHPAVIPIDVELVKKVAATLEATTVMTEDAPADQMVRIDLPSHELANFVSYVRTLDTEYRKVVELYQDVIAKNELTNSR